jgi:TRAP-type transport system small permease protein
MPDGLHRFFKEEVDVKRQLEWMCSLLAATALMGIMVLTFLDVGGRKLLSHSITGSLELTELMMVVVIFAGLPLVTLRDEHVTFDSLDGYLPAAVRWLQSKLVHLIMAVLMLGLAYLMHKTGLDFVANNDITAQLGIPKAPFIFGMALMCAVTGLLHLMMLFERSPTQADDAVQGGTL